MTKPLVAITGASSGIGAEIAVTMARAGAAVALVGRDRGRLAATRQRIEDSGGTAAVEIVADLTSQAGPREVIEAAVNKLDFAPFAELSAALSQPYRSSKEFERYAEAPHPGERVLKTFCGT